MKQDTAVSEVIGTVILIAIVTLFISGITLFCLSNVSEIADSGPVVSFRVSESPNYIYHAGGDAVLKSEIRIYYHNQDITEKTMIEGKSWDVWKTGEVLYLTEKYNSYQITIVGKTARGKLVILFEGIKTELEGVEPEE